MQKSRLKKTCFPIIIKNVAFIRREFLLIASTITARRHETYGNKRKRNYVRNFKIHFKMNEVIVVTFTTT